MPCGPCVGFTLLSELHVNRATWEGSDIACTSQFVSRKAGLLRPYPLILVSPKLRNLLIAENVKGLYFEIAHLRSEEDDKPEIGSPNQ